MKLKTNDKVNISELVMEKINKVSGVLFMLLISMVMISSCSDDDPSEQPEVPQVVGEIVINEVLPTGAKYIELYNEGSETADVSDYWLCLGPGQYFRLGTLTVGSGSLSMGAGDFLVVALPDLSDNAGGLGLYANNNDFANSDNIISFVQYGASGSARESVAVSAGIWTANQFVPTPLVGNTIEFDGSGASSSDWQQAYPSFGMENRLQDLKNTVAITEVDYANTKQVELRNNTDQSVDLADYWLCLGPGNYSQIGNLTVVSGSTNLGAGEHLVVTFDLLGSASDGLGLYSTNTFASADAIVDFVQYGASGSPREGVAVTAGVWTSGEFINTSSVQSGNTLSYDGGGVTASDWSVATESTLGEVNK